LEAIITEIKVNSIIIENVLIVFVPKAVKKVSEEFSHNFLAYSSAN